MKIARRAMKADVPSMAMGDIAFNLLIFFVILARAQDDSHVKWTPSIAPKLQAVKQSKVSVIVDQDNKVHLNGQPIGVSQLAGAIGTQLENATERAVLLKVHNKATATHFEPVVEAISEAGGVIYHILNEEKENQ